jgi:hypothetical protein
LLIVSWIDDGVSVDLASVGRGARRGSHTP